MVTFFGCSGNKPEKDKQPVARVYDAYLYTSDIAALVPTGTKKDDSVRIVEEYIDSWIRRQLILRVAEDNLQTALAKINMQAEEYKQTLIMYAYERQFLAENLDTLVREDTMQAYYEAHQEDFVLRSDIFRLAYAVVPVADKTADSVSYWFSRGMEKYRLPLERYCVQHAERFSLNTDIWLNANDLFTLLPYNMYADGKFRTKNVVSYADTSFRYFVQVKEFYTESSIGPFAYFKKEIRDIHINKRKKELLDETYKQIYTEGLKRNNAEIISKEE